MAFTVFGWQVTRDQTPANPQEVPVVPEENDDGAFVVDSTLYNGHVLTYEAMVKEEKDLIHLYRAIARHPEADKAIETITNEGIVLDDEEEPVTINMDLLDQPDNIKTKIKNEFNYILSLLDFRNEGSDLFREFYVDGRMYYNVVIDGKKPREGIKELRRIDAVDVKKVREERKERNQAGIEVVTKVEEYYAYTPSVTSMWQRYIPQNGANTYGQTIKLSTESVVFIHSGTVDSKRGFVLGFLDKAIKPLNQLRMMEDALVIYRLARAPERRAFYVDVGNLPKGKADQYMRSMMNRFRNKVTYDVVTGSVRNEVQTMSMMEDYWLPRREGGRSTEIQTIGGGQNLGNIEDILFFKKRALEALNVPSSRMESDDRFNLGRPSEITRDELMFAKFVQKVRRRFVVLFYELLKRQLILKGVITEAEWGQFKEAIRFDFAKDNHFYEFKEAEIVRERLQTLQLANDYVGVYFSIPWVRKNILKQTDEDIKEIDDQNKKDKDSKLLTPESMPFNSSLSQPDTAFMDPEDIAAMNGGDNPLKPKTPPNPKAAK